MAREMTPQERAAAIIGGHYECEDPWYSCPLSPDGCANANMGKECTCGYEDRKQNVERLITETRRAALLEARQAVLGERLSATEIYSSEDEAYNDAIDDALGAIDRLAQEG